MGKESDTSIAPYVSPKDYIFDIKNLLAGYRGTPDQPDWRFIKSFNSNRDTITFLNGDGNVLSIKEFGGSTHIKVGKFTLIIENVPNSSLSKDCLKIENPESFSGQFYYSLKSGFLSEILRGLLNLDTLNPQELVKIHREIRTLLNLTPNPMEVIAEQELMGEPAQDNQSLGPEERKLVELIKQNFRLNPLFITNELIKRIPVADRKGNLIHQVEALELNEVALRTTHFAVCGVSAAILGSQNLIGAGVYIGMTIAERYIESPITKVLTATLGSISATTAFGLLKNIISPSIDPKAFMEHNINDIMPSILLALAAGYSGTKLAQLALGNITPSEFAASIPGGSTVLPKLAQVTVTAVSASAKLASQTSKAFGIAGHHIKDLLSPPPRTPGPVIEL